MGFSGKILSAILIAGTVVLALSAYTAYKISYDQILESQLLYTSSVAEKVSTDFHNSLKEKVKTALILANTPTIKDALKNSNLTYAGLSREERKENFRLLDQKWMSITDSSDAFITRYTDNQVARFLRDQQETLKGEYGEIFLTNRYGALVAATTKLTTFAHGHKYWWLGAFHGGEGRIFLDDRGFDDSVGGCVLGLVTPVKDAGEVIGILKCNVRISGAISEALGETTNYDLGWLKLARSDGTVIFERGHKPLSTRVENPVYTRMKKNFEGSFRVEDKREGYLVGMHLIAMTTSRGEYGFGGTFESIDHKEGNTGESWYLVCYRPMTVVTGPVNAIIKWILLGGAAIILVLILVAQMVSRRIARPIKIFEEAAGKIGEGQFGYRIDYQGKDEFKRIAESLNSMAAQLERTTTSIHDLENEARQRMEAESELRESEKLLRSVIETEPNCIFLKDEEGRFILVNDAMARMHGTVPDDMLGKTDRDYLPASIGAVEEVEKFAANDKEVITTKKAKFTPEEKFTLADGTIRWFQTVKVPIFVEGKGDCVLGVAIDITHRKQSEAFLARERQMLSMVIEGTRAGTWEWHVQTGNAVFNERWAEIVGYTLKELEPISIETWIDMVHPDDLNVSNQLLEAHFSGRSPYYECECRMWHKDGYWIWVKDRGKVVRWSDEGTPLLMTGTHMDITERKQAEDALRDSERKFRTLFDTSPQALALTYVQTGRLLDVNETLCRITGYEKPELIGRTTTELGFYSEKDRNRFIDELKTSGKVNGLEMDFRIKDGSIVNMRMFAVPIQIEKEAFILTSLFDVTEQNRLEAELRRSQRMEAVATLTGGIAHDYNNLLTVILGNIAFAKETAGQEEIRLKTLRDAEQASLKMRDLTHRLMTLSKGGMAMRVPGAIQSVVEQGVRETVKGSPVEVVLNVPEDLLPVDHDAHQLRYAIENVARNAVESMPDGGKMTVSAENTVVTTGHCAATLPLKKGKYVQITIEDEGPGIPEAIKERIFDPYFSTKQRGTQKGMGLGLPVAYAVIRNHGGQIDVTSSPGKGTAVSMILPAWEAEKPEAEPVKKGPLPAGGSQEGSEKRVLVMDDEESLRSLIEKMLERMGYTVQTTADGSQAIDAYKQAMDQGKPFAAVILDLTNKKGMGGLDALKGLFEIDPAVKAIVSSGYFNDPVMADFKAYGFQAAIPKPYKLADFEQVVREVVTA